jgi:hypothetical protein
MRLIDLISPEELEYELYREIDTNDPEVIALADIQMREMEPYSAVLLPLQSRENVHGPNAGSCMMMLQIIDAILRKKVVN